MCMVEGPGGQTPEQRLRVQLARPGQEGARGSSGLDAKVGARHGFGSAWLYGRVTALGLDGRILHAVSQPGLTVTSVMGREQATQRDYQRRHVALQ